MAHLALISAEEEATGKSKKKRDTGTGLDEQESPFGSLLIGKNRGSYGVVVKWAAFVAVELPPI